MIKEEVFHYTNNGWEVLHYTINKRDCRGLHSREDVSLETFW